ncbi:MAG: DUF6311 domain-containing protein [Candidatus Sumerlaeales bacterium]|nr:DUF6311 domain-containing protein [Candidatus Sumerlaeales bacterium]
MTSHPTNFAKLIVPGIVGAIACVLFFAICGWQALNPVSTDWLMDNYDFPQHYMGWEFFRYAPLWQFPIGKNPLCGLDLSNSIVFTDSMPFYALLLHPFHPYLPFPFQYFGAAILICFIAQGFFGMRIAQTMTQSRVAVVLIATYFLVSPIFLWRLDCQIAAANHWIILAGLWFFMRPKFARIGWVVLFFLTSLLNYYFFPMIGVLLCGDIANRVITDRRQLPQMLLTFTVAFVTTLLTLYVIGVFMITSSGMQMPSHELFRANLVTPFDAETLWTCFMPNLPTRNPYGEGFGYLGTGVILLLLIGIASRLFAKRSVVANEPTSINTKHSVFFLTIIALFFWFISLSYKISFLQYNLAEYSYDNFRPLIAPFRAIGRLFWLPFYIIYVGVFALLIRALPHKALVSVLSVALMIQVADMHKAFFFLRDVFHDDPYTSPLQDPFWNEAAKKYTKIRLFFPSTHRTPSWLPISYYACMNHMGINSFPFARFDNNIKEQEDNRLWEILNGKRPYDSDTLYVFTHSNPKVWETGCKRASANDLAREIDGFKVVAPNWQTTATLSNKE